MVGAVRFELTTLCSQSRCATRLRYAPTASILPYSLQHAKQPVALISFPDRAICAGYKLKRFCCQRADAIIDPGGGYSSVAERRSVAADVLGSNPSSRPKILPIEPAVWRRSPSLFNLVLFYLDALLQDPTRACCRSCDSTTRDRCYGIKVSQCLCCQVREAMSGTRIDEPSNCLAQTGLHDEALSVVREPVAFAMQSMAPARFGAHPFQPRAFLGNGHLQTIAGRFFTPRQQPAGSGAGAGGSLARQRIADGKPCIVRVPLASGDGARRLAPRQSLCMAWKARRSRSMWLATPIKCGAQGPMLSA